MEPSQCSKNTETVCAVYGAIWPYSGTGTAASTRVAGALPLPPTLPHKPREGRWGWELKLCLTNTSTKASSTRAKDTATAKCTSWTKTQYIKGIGLTVLKQAKADNKTPPQNTQVNG